MKHSELHSCDTSARQGRFAVRLVRGTAAALLVSAIASGLSACFPLAAGSLIAGSMVAVDRRSVGAQTEDKTIEFKAGNNIGERFGSRVHVDVNSYNRRVLLAGEVPDAATKAEVGKLVGSIENVQQIDNELEVAPASSTGTHISDATISGKVRASFIDEKNLDASAFKITTERSVVYLQGRVTQKEGAKAAEIASGVSGVSKVVKVLEYISEDELKALQNKK